VNFVQTFHGRFQLEAADKVVFLAFKIGLNPKPADQFDQV
jgi:hypothetical protein